MENNFDNIEEMEAWLNGELNSIEKKTFNQKIESSPELKSRVNLLDDMIKGIECNNEDRIRKIANKVESKLEKEGFFEEKSNLKIAAKQEQKSSVFRWLSVAASFVLVLGACFYLFFNNNSIDNSLAYEKYYTPEKTVLPGILDRLEAQGLGTATNDKQKELARALGFYEKAKYPEALEALTTIQNQQPNRQIVLLYKGLSQLELSQYDRAIASLLPIAINKNSSEQNTAKWYLALAYIKSGHSSVSIKAVELLNDLSLQGSGFETKAKELKAYLSED